MRVILFQRRFASRVLIESKLQTIRRTARCKPGDVLSLREWTGKPYRSEQWEILQRVCHAVKPVRLHFERDGKFMIAVNGRNVRDRDAFARKDGFEGLNDMVHWFLKTYGMSEFNGWLIEWKKGSSPKDTEPPAKRPWVVKGYCLVPTEVSMVIVASSKEEAVTAALQSDWRSQIGHADGDARAAYDWQPSAE